VQSCATWSERKIDLESSVLEADAPSESMELLLIRVPIRDHLRHYFF
jgi:hypothetical protein